MVTRAPAHLTVLEFTVYNLIRIIIRVPMHNIILRVEDLKITMFSVPLRKHATRRTACCLERSNGVGAMISQCSRPCCWPRALYRELSPAPVSRRAVACAASETRLLPAQEMAPAPAPAPAKVRDTAIGRLSGSDSGTSQKSLY